MVFGDIMNVTIWREAVFKKTVKITNFIFS